MTTVGDLSDFLDSLAPRSLAYDWDNNGLLVGSRNTEVTKVLISLDPFEDTALEAVQWGAQAIISHHPLIFRPVKSVTDVSAVGRTVMLLLEHHISAINSHTCLDIAQGGVNDCLAGLLGLQEILTIGEESLLRCGTVDSMPLEDFLCIVKTKLGCPGLRYVDSGKPSHKIAVGGGACADELEIALSAGCDTFVTSDVKYNQFWSAKDSGINLIDAGHFYTENPVCTYLLEQLQAKFPEVSFHISRNHRDCMKFFV